MIEQLVLEERSLHVEYQHYCQGLDSVGRVEESRDELGSWVLDYEGRQNKVLPQYAYEYRDIKCASKRDVILLVVQG